MRSFRSRPLALAIVRSADFRGVPWFPWVPLCRRRWTLGFSNLRIRVRQVSYRLMCAVGGVWSMVCGVWCVVCLLWGGDGGGGGGGGGGGVLWVASLGCVVETLFTSSGPKR